VLSFDPFTPSGFPYQWGEIESTPKDKNWRKKNRLLGPWGSSLSLEIHQVGRSWKKTVISSSTIIPHESTHAVCNGATEGKGVSTLRGNSLDGGLEVT